MSNLPAELVQLLADHSPGQLSSLALVNKHYNHNITPMLYENISIQGYKLRPFARTIITGRPLLRGYPKSLSISTLFNMTNNHPDKIKPILRDLLMLTYNITYLSLRTSGHVVSYLMEQPDYPFRLRRLRIPEPPTSGVHLDNFYGFLEAQTQVEEIQLLEPREFARISYGSSDSLPDLESSALPHLASVHATSTWVPKLVSGRPVSRVYVNNPITDLELDAIHEALPQSLAPLTHLTIGVHVPLGDFWDALVLDFLSSIEYSRESLCELVLRVHCVSVQEQLEYRDSPSYGLDDVRNGIASFSKLKKFQLECSHNDLSPDFCASVPELAQFQLWEESCPTLQEVILFGVNPKDPLTILMVGVETEDEE
ncbi:hypothetical protein FS749_004142 [Ceratobasidium sp. UAMH 11750]|nr:hypothetical protein FS749_004142 [Ceratobasidium sp. UAMH 11750]